jgi:DNA-binding Lrp family transcriptional regulator
MNAAVEYKTIQDDISAAVLDDIDRKIVLATQDGLPLDPHPYEVIASQLDLSAAEVMQRMRRMQETGVIRRIGAVPNHYALGYRGNGMTVWDVPDEYIDELGRRVGELEFVSHCYHRPRHLPDWPYNLFAMVHAHSRDEALELVETIAALLGEHDRGHTVLFSSRILKKTGLRFQP